MVAHIRVFVSLIIFTVLTTLSVSAQSQNEAANQETVRRFLQEVVIGGDLNVLNELVADDFEYITGPGRLDQEGFAGFIEALGTAFPDAFISVEVMFADHDLVVDRQTYHGTFTGEFMTENGPVPPTNEPIRVHEQVIFRFNEAGEIAAIHDFYDYSSFLSQIGVLPMPEETAIMETIGITNNAEWEVLPMSENFEQTIRETVPNVYQRLLLEGSDTVAETFAPDFVHHPDPANPGVAVPLEIIVDNGTNLRAAFSNLSITTEDVAAKGNVVAFILRLGGTFENELLFNNMTIPPNGNQLAMDVHFIVLLDENERVIESWEVYDTFTLGMQLGLIEP